MPTGYTAGILDGTTKDFEHFAKLCSRAFIMHLREEPMNSEYKKREPNDYHSKAVDRATKDLMRINEMSDEEIMQEERDNIIECRSRYELKVKKQKEDKTALDYYLRKAKKYKPPTDMHDGIAKFMIEQLESTIEHDCSGRYWEEGIERLDDRFDSLDVERIRSDRKIEAYKDIARHTKEYEEELKRCREHNKWYDDFVKSLN